ncbi:ATP-binding protein [Nocardia alni]|uniref:ATP-binding protein n=1 Tax=Nocardia alni TaxID=2815723 RepID=UPI001C24483B|nr:ATP-binding protein [Nocardia alni]
MLPAEERLPGAQALIDEGLYFVVHAPRQTGKTTTLEALADTVSAAGDRVAICVSCETAQVAGDDYGAAEDIVLQMIRKAVHRRGYPESWLPPTPWPQAPAGTRINIALSEWAGQCPVPLVLPFDEIDAMLGPSMMTMLRQLRDGFRDRPDWFPASVVICGLRDVRDYKLAG